MSKVFGALRDVRDRRAGPIRYVCTSRKRSLLGWDWARKQQEGGNTLATNYATGGGWEERGLANGEGGPWSTDISQSHAKF